MDSDEWFLWTCCQCGAEPALKHELARSLPSARFAFSRPGFCTFKVPVSQSPQSVFELPLVFARARGVSLGKVAGPLPDVADDLIELVDGAESFDRLHLWSRDSELPGEKGFMPGPTTADAEAAHALATSLGQTRPELLREWDSAPNRIARPGHHVLDIVRVDNDTWWAGWHTATGISSRWPGGVHGRSLPPYAVSRAYLKIDEALRWSRLSIRAGDRCVEVGSAPGGACQALLDRKLHVTGIDPAAMDERVVTREGFVHLKKRLRDIRSRTLSGVDWLFVDANIAPESMLKDVEHLVSHKSVRLRGMLLTLKMANWKLAERIPEFITRVRSWGFQDVRVRQLAHNRREVCLAALKSRGFRRSVPRRK